MSKSAPRGRALSIGKLAKQAMTTPKAPKSPTKLAKTAMALPRMPGMGGFSVKRAPRKVNAPSTFAGRRTAAHAKAGC